MKRYRYGNPSSQSALQKARPYILLFVGWNLVGAMIWKFANTRAQKQDPDWFERSEVDRITRLVGNNPSSAKKYSYTLGSSEESSATSTSSTGS